MTAHTGDHVVAASILLVVHPPILCLTRKVSTPGDSMPSNAWPGLVVADTESRTRYRCWVLPEPSPHKTWQQQPQRSAVTALPCIDSQPARNTQQCVVQGVSLLLQLAAVHEVCPSARATLAGLAWSHPLQPSRPPKPSS